MKTLALVGAQGMLGRDLLRRARARYRCLPADIEEIDITDREAVLRWVEAARPEILVNVAAYTDVDGCESQPERASRVNGEAPGHLAEACARLGALIVQISTDFVFDGTKEGGYTEEDRPAPLSAYGTSKLLGETRIREQASRWLIVRTSWLYGLGGRNFVEAILNKASQGGPLRVVDDQRGSPTHVPDLSEALLRLLAAGAQGMVHVCNAGSCTWFDFARAILAGAGREDVLVEPITSSELDRPARRPANSVLACNRYHEITGARMRPWEEALRDYLAAREAAGAKNGGR